MEIMVNTGSSAGQEHGPVDDGGGGADPGGHPGLGVRAAARPHQKQLRIAPRRRSQFRADGLPRDDAPPR